MKEKTAILFPGQGIQSIGMGKKFYDTCPVAKNIFDSACKIMKGYKQLILKERRGFTENRKLPTCNFSYNNCNV